MSLATVTDPSIHNSINVGNDKLRRLAAVQILEMPRDSGGLNGQVEQITHLEASSG